HAAAWGVSNTADTPIGQACASFTGCSLREALTSTELNPGPDAILVSGGTYILTNGPLTITQDLQIARVGAFGATISGNNAQQLFIVTGSTIVVFRFLTLSGGSATTGGAINVGVGANVSVEIT